MHLYRILMKEWDPGKAQFTVPMEVQTTTPASTMKTWQNSESWHWQAGTMAAVSTVDLQANMVCTRLAQVAKGNKRPERWKWERWRKIAEATVEALKNDAHFCKDTMPFILIPITSLNCKNPPTPNSCMRLRLPFFPPFSPSQPFSFFCFLKMYLLNALYHKIMEILILFFCLVLFNLLD